MKKLLLLVVLVGLILYFILGRGCAGAPTPPIAPTPTLAPAPTIMDVLEEDPQFSTLVMVINSAGMADRLRESGPFTLFAPTNDAFLKLPPETLAALLQKPAALQTLLSYHLVAAALPQSSLTTQGSVTTVQGGTITVKDDNGAIKLNNARILAAEATASNGLVDAIDTVLTAVAPPPPPAPSDLNGDFESWEPYPEGQPLPIRDAELVPGAPEIRQGVVELSGLLKEIQARINIARSVRLTEANETTYAAPIGPEPVGIRLAERGIQVLGVLILTGDVQFETGPGAFLVIGSSDANLLKTATEQQTEAVIRREAIAEAATEITAQPLEPAVQGQIAGPITADLDITRANIAALAVQTEDTPPAQERTPGVAFMNAEGKIVAIVEAVEIGAANGKIPGAAIFYGTKYCGFLGYCFACGLFGPFDTLAACQAAQ